MEWERLVQRAGASGSKIEQEVGIGEGRYNDCISGSGPKNQRQYTPVAREAGGEQYLFHLVFRCLTIREASKKGDNATIILTKSVLGSEAEAGGNGQSQTFERRWSDSEPTP